MTRKSKMASAFQRERKCEAVDDVLTGFGFKLVGVAENSLGQEIATYRHPRLGTYNMTPKGNWLGGECWGDNASSLNAHLHRRRRLEFIKRLVRDCGITAAKVRSITISGSKLYYLDVTGRKSKHLDGIGGQCFSIKSQAEELRDLYREAIAQL